MCDKVYSSTIDSAIRTKDLLVLLDLNRPIRCLFCSIRPIRPFS